MEVKEKFIEMMADGYNRDEITRVLCSEAYGVEEIAISSWYRDPDILLQCVEQASSQLGQSWGVMWKQIKLKAELGSVKHAKLLIDYFNEQKPISAREIKISFDDDGKK